MEARQGQREIEEDLVRPDGRRTDQSTRRGNAGKIAGGGAEEVHDRVVLHHQAAGIQRDADRAAPLDHDHHVDDVATLDDHHPAGVVLHHDDHVATGPRHHDPGHAPVADGAARSAATPTVIAAPTIDCAPAADDTWRRHARLGW